MLNGVLRGQHKEGAGKLVALTCGSHGAFLHGFQQGGLGFRWRPVDLVGQDDVRKQRALDKLELARLIQNFSPDDVAGHQVWGELDAVEAQPQRLGNGVDQQGLGQTRHTDQKDVTARKNGGRHFADDVFLAHNDFSHLSEQGLVLGAERVKRGFVVGKIRHGSGASRLLPEDSHVRRPEGA